MTDPGGTPPVHYYADKSDGLKRLFGARTLSFSPGRIHIDDKIYPVIQDVIILLDPSRYTDFVKRQLRRGERGEEKDGTDFARDIQSTFGAEWEHYGKILPEHREEFQRYFDLLDLPSLRSSSICDLGCGIGRWSHFLKDIAKELFLVDFSDAIFVARKNMADAKNAFFFMGDLKRLPFTDDFCDLLFSLGVLHHLPTDCLDETRALRRYSPRTLVFLYYALDNRPFYFRWILGGVTGIRRILCQISNPAVRKIISVSGALLIYKPLVLLGKILRPFGLSQYIPLYEFYHDKSLGRIEQDVYDRFFTRIEQRVTRQEILSLRDTFTEVTVSDRIPYWHFLCVR
ncbi:MAG TPA: methyltransferase domain-containing protein [Elusimicrobiota bacterium]|nr:methyltransferase domain-containing protein [Elusimicrobiota bacterium]